MSWLSDLIGSLGSTRKEPSYLGQLIKQSDIDPYQDAKYGILADPARRQQFIQSVQPSKFNLMDAIRTSAVDTFTKPQVWEAPRANFGSWKGSGLLEDFVNSPFKQGQGLVQMGQGQYKQGLGNVVTGSIEGPLGLLPVGKTAQVGLRGGRLMPRVLAGAKYGAREGAVYGGAYGAGNAASQDGSLSDVIKQALMGGAIGGVGGGAFGGGVPLAGAGVRAGGRAIDNRIPTVSADFDPKSTPKRYKSPIEALESPEMQAKWAKVNAQQKSSRVTKTSNNLYHTTSAENLESIKKNGLLPNQKQRFEGVGDGSLSFSANEKGANYYGKQGDVLIRTKTSYKPKDLDLDLLAGGEGTYRTNTAISPTDLEVKVNEKWQPLTQAQPPQSTNKLYRETSIDRALDMMPLSGRLNPDAKYDGSKVFFATDKNLARGQKENKGILLEFDNSFKTQENLNAPGLPFVKSAGGGAEVTAKIPPSQLRKHLSSITIKSDAMASKVEIAILQRTLKRLVAEDKWTKTKNLDGSITYAKPATQARGK